MPKFVVKHTVDVAPDGTITIGPVVVEVEGEVAQTPASTSGPIDTVLARTPERLRSYVESLIDLVVAEGCTIETPPSAKGGLTDSWSIMLPERCKRHARAGAANYHSTRMAAFAGRPDLKALGFKIAQETMNNGVYAYPKIPRLNSDEAVAEGYELIKLAIKHFGG